MNKSTMTGVVEYIGNTQEFTSGFKKRDIIINNGDKYAPYVSFTAKSNNCDLVDKATVGDEVEVTFVIDGDREIREFGDAKRTFFSLTILGIEVKSSANSNNGKPTIAKSWAELLKLGEAYGKTKDEVTNLCKGYVDACNIVKTRPNGKMIDEDFQAVADTIVEEFTSKSIVEGGAEIQDDFPF